MKLLIKKKSLFSVFIMIFIIVCSWVLWHSRSLTLTPDSRLDFSLDNEIKTILIHASLAPSNYNSQMWRVRINPTQQKLAIHLDSNRLLFETDPYGREAYITMGAFLYSLQQAFYAYGYQTKMDIYASHNLIGNPLVAEVTYNKPVQIILQPTILALLKQRYTNKQPYSDKPIAATTIEKLLANNPQLYFYHPTTAQYAYLKQGVVAAYQQMLEQQNKLDELVLWLRFSDEETLEKRDGLPAELLNIKGLEKALYYLLADNQSVKSPPFIRRLIDNTRQRAEHNAGFFVLTGNNTPLDWINAGMQMQTFWLAATKQQLALQPMTQMLLETPYREEIQNKLALDTPVQMIFRAGYADKQGKNKNIRRRLQQFIELIEVE